MLSLQHLSARQRLLPRWTTFLLALFFAGGTAGAQGTISGTVKDKQSGSPLAGVHVVAVAENGTRTDTALTRDDGTYRFVGLGPGTYRLNARRVGYAPAVLPSVRVGPESPAELDLELESARFDRLSEIVVVGVGRYPETLERAPASVDLVRTEQVEERPAITLVDHLVGRPGVDVASTGVMQKNVVLRGFNNIFSGATLMLSDFRYATVPSLRVNAGYLMPNANEDVDRIEVIMGPSSALYGPNGANGLVHVITRSPFDSPGTTLSIAGGERSVSRVGGRYAVVLGSRVALKLSGQYMRGVDWETTDSLELANRDSAIARGADPDTLLIGRRDADVRRWTGEARLDIRPAQGSEIILAAGTATAGSATELTGLGAAQVRDWRYDYYQVRATLGRLFAQAFINTSDAGRTYVLRTGLPIIDRSYAMAAQLQHGFDLGDRQSFSYGIDAQRTTPRTEGTITGRNEDRDRIDEIGVYVQSTTGLSPRLDLITALRLDRHSHVADDIVSPRAGLVFRPADGHKLRVTYNRAFNTPTTNQLFLDLVALSDLGGLPYDVRTIGVPEGGFRYRRDCAAGVGGLCMRSPVEFGAPDSYIPAEATQFWAVVQQMLYAQGVDIRSIPAPTPAQVATVLRQLNPTTGAFGDVDPAAVLDIDQIRPSINSVYEIGYNADVADRMRLSADVYYERRHDFVGPLVVETPNAFLEPVSLAAYLASRGLSPAQAAAIAGAATRIPLGTVTPESDLTDGPDLMLTYRNFGEVDLWGTNLGIQAYLTDRVSVEGTWSHVSDDFFPRSKVGGLSDIALNAPKNKGSLGVQYRNESNGLSLGARGRFAEGFPMNSGVYVGDIEDSRQLDLSLAWRLPMARGAIFSIDATNVLDERHQQFIGGPAIGRFVMTKLQYSF